MNSHLHGTRSVSLIATGLLGAALAILRYTEGQNLAGRYDIKTEHVECCPSAILDRPFPCTVSHVRDRQDLRNVFFAINFTMNHSFDDYKDAQVVYSSWSSRGGWKENAIVMKFRRVCTSLRIYLPGVWRHFLDHTTGPTGPVHECPLPPGSYAYYNFSSGGITPANIPSLYYGKWRVDTRVYDRRETCIMCIRMTLRISPKANQG
ncbi:uncharacterized protein LOC117649757 [Thrips palmi]|uniref:Uncharacterized protein LOC117649757 n=1 Tax=Thrips palmi TaxID=161013 RepID=A0A6P8ZTT2_THRPL|nr:uncharacterized protein LOC117649757 [Thrips palmi]